MWNSIVMTCHRWPPRRIYDTASPVAMSRRRHDDVFKYLFINSDKKTFICLSHNKLEDKTDNLNLEFYYDITLGELDTQFNFDDIKAINDKLAVVHPQLAESLSTQVSPGLQLQVMKNLLLD